MSALTAAIGIVVLIVCVAVVSAAYLAPLRMSLPPKKCDPDEMVDLDRRDVIPLNDGSTEALFFGLSLRVGMITMHEVTDGWVVRVDSETFTGDKTFFGASQREALKKLEASL